MKSQSEQDASLDARRALESMWSEMRREVESIARAMAGDPAETTRFPDPIVLNPIERRILAKSVFSFVESLAYSMKAWALADSMSASLLTLAERTLAAEESHELNASGGVVTRRARLRTLSNLRFAFRILAKVNRAEFHLDVSNSGWSCLQRALKVRDRLTHPKQVIDLNVNDNEIRDVLRAFIWFEGQFILLLVAIVRTLEEEASVLRKALEEKESR